MPVHIAFLVFPRIQQLDLAGPYEVFASMPDTEIHLVWKDRAPVVSESGLGFTPTTTFADCRPADVLCVPGGTGVNALMQDGEVLDFVRGAAAGARYVTSVCTGALVLAAAGLLRRRRATTHWASHDFLERFGAFPVHERVVRDGNLITAGGVTAGIDFGLTVVAELASQSVAESIQLGLEYAPQPPFRAGTPDEAPPAVLAKARERQAESRRQREAIVAAITGRDA